MYINILIFYFRNLIITLVYASLCTCFENEKDDNVCNGCRCSSHSVYADCWSDEYQEDVEVVVMEDCKCLNESIYRIKDHIENIYALEILRGGPLYHIGKSTIPFLDQLNSLFIIQCGLKSISADVFEKGICLQIGIE